MARKNTAVVADARDTIPTPSLRPQSGIWQRKQQAIETYIDALLQNHAFVVRGSPEWLAEQFEQYLLQSRHQPDWVLKLNRALDALSERLHERSAVRLERALVMGLALFCQKYGRIWPEVVQQLLFGIGPERLMLLDSFNLLDTINVSLMEPRVPHFEEQNQGNEDALQQLLQNYQLYPTVPEHLRDNPFLRG